MNIYRPANDRALPINHPRIEGLLEKFNFLEQPKDHYMEGEFLRVKTSRNDDCFYSIPLSNTNLLWQHAKQSIAINQGYSLIKGERFDIKKVSDVYFSPSYSSIFYKYNGREETGPINIDIEELKRVNELISRDEIEQDFIEAESIRVAANRRAMELV